MWPLHGQEVVASPVLSKHGHSRVVVFARRGGGQWLLLLSLDVSSWVSVLPPENHGDGHGETLQGAQGQAAGPWSTTIPTGRDTLSPSLPTLIFVLPCGRFFPCHRLLCVCSFVKHSSLIILRMKLPSSVSGSKTSPNPQGTFVHFYGPISLMVSEAVLH